MTMPRICLRWLYLHALFTTLGVGAVLLGMLLVHRLVRLHRETVTAEMAWFARQDEFAELHQLALQCSLPGNDVFASEDVAAESARLKQATGRLYDRLAATRRSLKQQASPTVPNTLVEDLNAIESSVRAMAALAERGFVRFGQGDVRQAAQTMAEMDRQGNRMHRGFAELRAHVRAIQGEHAARNASAARAMARLELALVGLAIALIVGSAAYTLTLAGKLTRDAREKEHALQRLRAAQAELSQAHATLEHRIEERTAELRRIAWLLGRFEEDGPSPQPYGDLTVLNTSRLILGSVGSESLRAIVSDYLDLLDTSAAVYEKNGDYALGLFSSSWCRFMDGTSRTLCDTSNNCEALRCGKWHCHESCWGISKESIDTTQPVDRECLGGLRIYAVPIFAHGEVVGSINFGYGDPPRDPDQLVELAERYGVGVDALRREADAYESRPPYIVDLAKKRLLGSAKLIGAIIEREQAERELRRLNDELEQRVTARTEELEAANCELDAFCYSISHDLRAPLRAVDGFSRILAQDYGNDLAAPAREHLQSIRDGAQQMGRLIDDLLDLSRLGRQPLRKERVSPVTVVSRAMADLRATQEQHNGEISVGQLPDCWADPALLKQVFVNLLSNALKYSRGRDPVCIEVGCQPPAATDDPGARECIYFVRDNGVGFDMRYAHKLFGVFQRLHHAEDYEGTGVGLAIVQRIIHRHGGRVWAEGEPDKGATFYFTLERAAQT